MRALSAVVLTFVALCGHALAQVRVSQHPLQWAVGMSSDGRVVVGASGNAAAYWTQAEGAVFIVQPASGYYSRAVGVSGDGTIIAGYTAPSGNGLTSSWIWTRGAGVTPVTVPGLQPKATCLSRDGQTVGGIVLGASDHVYHSFIWTVADGGRTLPEGKNYSTWLRGLSPNGLRAVGSGSSGVGTWGTLWNSTYVWCQNLGVVSGQLRATAHAVTPDGRMVVGSVGEHAMIWTTDGGITELTIPAYYGLALMAVSDDGRIAGGGINHGVVWRKGIGLQYADDFWTSMIGAVHTDGSAITAISPNGRVFLLGEPMNIGGKVIDLGPCGSADFNHDGATGTDQDIEAFFRCLSGDCCPMCDGADFNFDGDVGTDADIEAFFRVLSGGHC